MYYRLAPTAFADLVALLQPFASPSCAPPPAGRSAARAPARAA
jgi:hypothetical protein